MGARRRHAAVTLSLLLLSVVAACLKRGSDSAEGDATDASTGDAVQLSNRSPEQLLDSQGSDPPAGATSVVLAAPDSAAKAPPPQSSQGHSALAMAVDDAWLLVTDPAGRRTGFLSGSMGKRDEIREIPRSDVYVDAIDDDVTGESDPGFTATVHVSEPADTLYRVVVGSDKAQTIELAIDGFSTDASRQRPIRMPIALEPGGRAEFRLRFSPSPGAAPRLERVAPP